MAVQFIQARVTNPGGPAKRSATTSERKMRKSRKKIKIVVGRKSNPAKRKPRKRSLAKRASARVKALLARLRGGSKRRKPRRKSRKAAVVVARAANPRKRHGIKRRRHNPAFDVKHALMTGAVLIAGAYVGLKLVPYIESKLKELAPDTLGGKTLGYVQLVGAAATIVAGDYLQKKIGSRKVDIAPAAYAIAAIMAVRGLRNAELIASDAPMLGMGGTLDFGSGLAYGGGYAAPANGMGALPRGYSMLGTIQTAEMLPAPPVAPHNVMQGYHHGASLV